MRVPMHVVLVVLACFALAACSSDNGSSDDDSTPDAQTDTTGDAGDDSGTDDTGDDVADDTEDVGDDTVADVGDDTTDAGDAADADADVEPMGLPQELPFEFERDPIGDAPTEQEIDDFTTAITGLWAETDYFAWVRMTSHGIDASNEEGWFHYALWWQDTQAIREGDAVVFEHRGRADNLTLRTCKVLTTAIAGYMLTGDENMRWIVEEYSRGLAALAMANEFEENDENRYIQARAIFTRNHEYETLGGRQVVIDYDPVRRLEESWNAAIIHNPTNPHWGDIHIVNQRSKDDLPHMFRAVPMLMRAAEDAPDASVREAAELALEYLAGFAQDVVDTGYRIRTRWDETEPVVPTLENGNDKDLASLVQFEDLVPNAECPAKLATALVAGGDPLDNMCGTGAPNSYETVATSTHYFNYAIVRYFHIAALHNALMLHENDLALELMQGMADRADGIMYDMSMPNRDSDVWEADAAAFLIAAAAAGLPAHRRRSTLHPGAVHHHGRALRRV